MIFHLRADLVFEQIDVSQALDDLIDNLIRACQIEIGEDNLFPAIVPVNQSPVFYLAWDDNVKELLR